MFNYRVLSVMLLILSLAFVACEKDEEKDEAPGGEEEAMFHHWVRFEYVRGGRLRRVQGYPPVGRNLR